MKKKILTYIINTLWVIFCIIFAYYLGAMITNETISIIRAFIFLIVGIVPVSLGRNWLIKKIK